MDYGDEFQQTALIAQAQDMVSVQAKCTIPTALMLMKQRAVVRGQTLDQIATAVLEREIRFGA